MVSNVMMMILNSQQPADNFSILGSPHLIFFKQSIKSDPYRNGGGVMGDRFDRIYPPIVMSIFTLQTL